MGFGSLLSEAAGGVSAKAMLCIPYATVDDLHAEDSDNAAIDGSIRYHAPLSRNQSAVHELVESTASNAQQKMLSLYLKGDSSIGKLRSGKAAGGYSSLQVDYNPSSISFSTQNEGEYSDKQMKSGLYSISKSCEVQMNVELIFDDVSVQDAFMWDRFQLSAKSAVSAIKAVAGAEHTVRVPIEGIISLIRHQLTRNVAFIWGPTLFYGMLTQVDARYTMFNPQGNPVRGTVSLSLIQNLQGGVGVVNDYWNKAFDKMTGVRSVKDLFKNTAVSASDRTGVVGNLLQL